MPLCQLGVINRFRAERLRPELTLITQNECQEVCLIFRSWWGVCFFFFFDSICWCACVNFFGVFSLFGCV
jgi:hypothetical protein